MAKQTRLQRRVSNLFSTFDKQDIADAIIKECFNRWRSLDEFYPDECPARTKAKQYQRRATALENEGF